MKKDQVDLENKVIWIPDSKTPNGVAAVPLTDLAVAAVRDQMQLAPDSPVSVPQRKRRRPSDDVQDRLAADAAASEGPVSPHLRPALDLRDATERWRRGGRVGDAASPAGRRESVQEVLADEIADEARGVAEAQSDCQRVSEDFGTGRLRS